MHRIDAVGDLDGWHLGWYEVVMGNTGLEQFQFYVRNGAGEERTFFTQDYALARGVRDRLISHGGKSEG